MEKLLISIALFIATTNTAYSSRPCYSRSCREFEVNFIIFCFIGFIVYLLLKKFLQEPIESKPKIDTIQNPKTTNTHNYTVTTTYHQSRQTKVDQPSDLSHKKAGIMAAIADGKLSYEQACAIEKYQKLYNFNSEQIIEIRKISRSK